MNKMTYTAAGLAEILLTASGPSQTEIIRMIRHYAGDVLLMPLGAVNTGTGNKRLYASDAPLRAAVLMQLNRFGVPIGVLKRVFRFFEAYLKAEFKTNDLIEVASKLKAPCLFVSLPEDGDSKTRRYVVVGEISRFEKLATRPLIAIPLSPYLEQITPIRP
jgi:hypothetical protein